MNCVHRLWPPNPQRGSEPPDTVQRALSKRGLVVGGRSGPVGGEAGTAAVAALALVDVYEGFLVLGGRLLDGLVRLVGLGPVVFQQHGPLGGDGEKAVAGFTVTHDGIGD